jgi:hypothetical protein
MRNIIFMLILKIIFPAKLNDDVTARYKVLKITICYYQNETQLFPYMEHSLSCFYYGST